MLFYSLQVPLIIEAKIVIVAGCYLKSLIRPTRRGAALFEFASNYLQRCAMVKRTLGLAGCTRTRAEWSLRPPERAPAVRNEQEHRSEARMPCELPGLAQRPFAGRALRSKAGARGGNP
jgi:hypothetical protein